MGSIILGAVVIVVSLIAIAVQAKLMSKQAFAGFLLALVLVISGGNLILNIQNSAHFGHTLSSVCTGQREVARTGAEALTEQNEENIGFLSKSSSFPGFTHQELQTLIEHKKIKAADRVKRLETVANNTCKGDE